MPKGDESLSAEQLLARAAAVDDTDPFHYVSRYVGMANAKIGIRRNELTKRTNELTDEQIQASQEANELTKSLLKSNEEASRQNERSAELMNAATLQLAKSTESLNKATWVLVAVTFVQALIAFAALYVSISSRK